MAHRSEFAFAPLPVGGDARALQRALERAGFAGVQLHHRDADFFVLSARRDPQR